MSALRRIFSQHGLPEIIVSDNGSQFTSSQFDAFCRQHLIEHIRSPPYHPQSNGQAERFVDTFKRALCKARGEGTSDEIIHRFLLSYRSTPNRTLPNAQSPAEALMGRKLRTTHQALIPIESTRKPTTSPDRVSPIIIGTAVYARDYRPRSKPWTTGTVITRRGKVLYDVSVDGEKWIRHRNQLRPRHGNDDWHEETTLPLDLLLDTFQLDNSSERPTDPAPITPEVTLLPRRWSLRRRRPTRRMQVDSRRSHYH
ncbi:MAG: DDE-type integrase/transposase/recombinase [Aeromonas sp.]